MNFDRFLREAAFLEGLEWRKYRRRSARHRVEQRITELGLDGFAAYLDFLRSDPVERAGLADLMRVTVSRFFREREMWRILAEKVLPALIAEKKGRDPIRAWSAGCCGGEEPFTLAMVWLESFAPLHPGKRIEIIASDIDEASLERAGNASYDIGSLREGSSWSAKRNNSHHGPRPFSRPGRDAAVSIAGKVEIASVNPLTGRCLIAGESACHPCNRAETTVEALHPTSTGYLKREATLSRALFSSAEAFSNPILIVSCTGKDNTFTFIGVYSSQVFP